MEDIHHMSLEELRLLRTRISNAIAVRERERRRTALAELQAIARKFGFSMNELVDASLPKRRAPARTKFRHPENALLAWSGRGKQPTWFSAALRDGFSESELRVE